jgi:hypothetical protein
MSFYTNNEFHCTDQGFLTVVPLSFQSAEKVGVSAERKLCLASLQLLGEQKKGTERK